MTTRSGRPYREIMSQQGTSGDTSTMTTTVGDAADAATAGDAGTPESSAGAHDETDGLAKREDGMLPSRARGTKEHQRR